MKNLTYIFAATLFMVACNNEEISSLQDGKNLEVKFTSNLTDYDSQVVSRVNGTSFEQDDQVAIWASSAGTAPFTGKKVLTAGADGKLSSTETFTYQDDNEVSFSALYPASLCDGTEQSDITLETQTVDGYQTLQDLLYATGTGSAGSPTVNLPFYHKGVKIDVAVKQGDGINLTDAEVFVKAKSGGVFSFANSSITPTGAEATDIKIPLVIVPDFTNNVNYGSTIVAPQTLEGECIGIKLQGEATTKYLTYSKIELKEGFRYCFNIDTRKNAVGDVEISIADGQVSEEPWLSDAATTGVVEVDEIKQLAPGDNLITNSDFESGISGWGGWGGTGDEQITTKQSEYGNGYNGGYSFEVTNPSNKKDWEAQVAHDFSEEPLIQGATYRLTMDIKGSVAGSISAALQRMTDYKGAGDFPGINITTEWTHYEGEVVVAGDGANHADRFLLNIGQYVGTIYIDNVTLCQLISE